MDVIEMQFVGIGDKVQRVALAQFFKHGAHFFIFPKNIIPQISKGLKINFTFKSLLGMREKLPGRDFSACVGLLYFGGKEMFPNFFEGDVGFFGESFAGFNRIEMNEDVAQIKNDGFNHGLTQVMRNAKASFSVRAE